MGKSIAERMEILRNARFAIRRKLGVQKDVRFLDIVRICGSKGNVVAADDERVAFIGFFNEFDDVYGKDCVYIHLFADIDREWLARRAIAHGAIAVISEYQIADIPCIVVKDVWQVLKELSKLYIDDVACGRVAIAGSIGKTTTKEMVETVLSQRFSVFCTPNNGNVLSYLAFEIQHMPRNVEQFIQEVDESYPKNAGDCSYVLRPDIAIITNIDDSHIGALGNEKAVEEAIVDVTKHMSENGTVIVNADDPKSAKVKFERTVVTIGIDNQNADCTATEIEASEKSVDFVISYCGENANVHLNCPGAHNIYNAMFAFIVGKLNGMKTTAICRGLRKYKPMAVRQNTVKAFGKTLYIDCFNASARSIDAALAVVSKMQPGANGRRVAVIGDVAEIDGFEENIYKKIADSINRSGIDILVTYGRYSKCLQESFAGEGAHFNEKEPIARYLKHLLRFGDVVLFKASGNMKMERIVGKTFPVSYQLALLRRRVKTIRWTIKTI